jgi:hypothetical protein
MNSTVRKRLILTVAWGITVPALAFSLAWAAGQALKRPAPHPVAALTEANADILRVARAIPDGGGFCPLSDSGVAEQIDFNGQRILRQSKTATFYCSGFTFAVAMQVARDRRHLDGKSLSEVRLFQRQWYGSKDSAPQTKQLVTALQTLQIGWEIPPLQAKPGDFIVFWRDDRTGHSAVFLSWVYERDVIVGFRYRSAQPATHGVGDRTEYFTSSGFLEGRVIPRSFFVGRMS